jgi:hypothetical protein
MIRYACPRCRTVLECPDQAAGSKHACPTCGQRLQVPLPPPNKTVLAPLVLPQGPPYPQAVPVRLPVAQLVPETPAAAPAAPEGRGRGLRVALLGCCAAALAAGLFLLAGGVAYVASSGWSIPRAVAKGWGGGGGDSVGKGDLRLGVLLVEADRTEAMMYVLAENRSDARKVDFLDNLGQAGRPYALAVTDDLGNKYQLAAGLNHPTLRLGVGELRPKEFLVFEVLCEEPVEKARCLNVDLPSLDVRSDEHFRFRLPVQRETLTYTPPPADLQLFLGQKPQPVTRRVVYKRDDFREWFGRWDDRLEQMRREARR